MRTLGQSGMGINPLQVTETDVGYLRSNWHALTNRYAADGAPSDRWYEVLTSSYSGPDRHYHNLRHVAEVLRLLEQFAGNVSDRATIFFAAWFHDAVYDTRSRTNEEESAALANRALSELGVPPEVGEAVRRLILATKRHEIEDAAPDLGLFLDADLSILGAPDMTYAAYSEAIRKEYSWVPDEAYREGRLKFLTTFLGRERLYHTGPMARRFESQARNNLSNEVKALST